MYKTYPVCTLNHCPRVPYEVTVEVGPNPRRGTPRTLHWKLLHRSRCTNRYRRHSLAQIFEWSVDLSIFRKRKECCLSVRFVWREITALRSRAWTGLTYLAAKLGRRMIYESGRNYGEVLAKQQWPIAQSGVRSLQIACEKQSSDDLIVTTRALGVWSLRKVLSLLSCFFFWFGRMDPTKNQRV